MTRAKKPVITPPSSILHCSLYADCDNADNRQAILNVLKAHNTLYSLHVGLINILALLLLNVK